MGEATDLADSSLNRVEFKKPRKNAKEEPGVEISAKSGLEQHHGRVTITLSEAYFPDVKNQRLNPNALWWY